MRKTIVIDQQVSIAAAPEAVFAYACDYRNDPHWRSGVGEMSIDSVQGTHTGDHTEEVMRVLGRTTRTEAIITAHEPNRRTAFRTLAGDLTAHGYRETQPTVGGTIFTYHAEAELAPAFRVIARSIEWLFNRRAANDLRRLRASLERASR